MTRPARLACALLCCAAALPCLAEDWIRLPLADEQVAYYIDAASLVRNGDRVQFRERISFANPDQRDEASGKLIKEKRILRLMDCKGRTQGMLEGALFSDQNRMIESVSYTDGQPAMSKVPGGSLAAWELDFVCKLTAGDGQNVDMPTAPPPGQAAMAPPAPIAAPERAPAPAPAPTASAPRAAVKAPTVEPRKPAAAAPAAHAGAKNAPAAKKASAPPPRTR